MNKLWSLKGHNRGASLIAVLVTIMFVSVIGIVISQITITNIQMKEMEQKGKTNFYDAEMVLDDLTAGLNTMAASSMQQAYSTILSKYRTVTATGGSVQGTFERHYIDNMIAVFATSDDGGPKTKKNDDGEVIYQAGYYSLSKVKEAFSVEDYKDMLVTVPSEGTDSVAWYQANYQEGTFVLQGIRISVEGVDESGNKTGYITNIQTDMVFSAPPLDFEANYNVKEFMRYSLIANNAIHVSGRNMTINGNVYAGAGGIYADDENVVNSKFLGKTIVTRGDISSDNAKYQVGDGTSNIWTENIKSYGGVKTELTLNGNIFVSDDLEMDGKGGTVILKGYYYGYNFQKNYGSASSGDGADYSSAIALNGKDSKLNMLELKQLMLAGRTYLKRKIGNKLTGEIDIGIADVPLGESVSVRTNQMAYYIPSDFLDFTGTRPVFKNSSDVSRYLGIGNVLSYVSEADPVTEFHYIQTSGGTNDGVVYYLKFAGKSNSEGVVTKTAEQSANDFFAEYYSSNKARISPYAEYYADNDGIILPNTEGSLDIMLTLKGDIMYRMKKRTSDSEPSNLSVGRIEISGSSLDTTDFRNYAGRLAVKYKSLQMYLEESHSGITASDVRFPDYDPTLDPDNAMAGGRVENCKWYPGMTLLDNLLAPATTDSTNYTYEVQCYLKDQPQNKKEIRYNESGMVDPHGEYIVALVDNASNSKLGKTGWTYSLENGIKGGIVIATGDVSIETTATGEGDSYVEGVFSGCVISGGTISFVGNAYINANELLVSQLFANDLRSSNREFTQFFKGYEVVTDAEMGRVKIDRYLTYDNWTKTID